MAAGDRKTLTDAAVALLAAGKSVAAAAQACGVSERTLYRRLKERDFCQQVAEARAQLVDRATGRLAAYANPVAARLHALSRSANPVISLGACKALLDYTLRFREHEQLAAELEQVKARLKEAGL